ncbi:alcohol dehydrogenase catalytic domain-containing protein [Bradyrhizobium sp. RDT10]
MTDAVAIGRQSEHDLPAHRIGERGEDRADLHLVDIGVTALVGHHPAPSRQGMVYIIPLPVYQIVPICGRTCSMTASRIVELVEFGGPEVLKVVQRDVPPPAAGEVQIRHKAIGFNFIDIYQRKGIYPLPLPTGLGFEAVGVIEAAGPGVSDHAIGERVAYMNAGVGAYSERRNVAADKLVKLPDSVSDEMAATLLFKGMTAQYLLRRTHRVEPGDVLLVHSAAGGVGQILTRWATALGATVFGTTGSPEKRETALAAGCKEVLDLNDPQWPEAFLAASGTKAVSSTTRSARIRCCARSIAPRRSASWWSMALPRARRPPSTRNC